MKQKRNAIEIGLPRRKIVIVIERERETKFDPRNPSKREGELEIEK